MKKIKPLSPGTNLEEQIKNGKSPGEDGLPVGILRAKGRIRYETTTKDL